MKAFKFATLPALLEQCLISQRAPKKMSSRLSQPSEFFLNQQKWFKAEIFNVCKTQKRFSVATGLDGDTLMMW